MVLSVITSIFENVVITVANKFHHCGTVNTVKTARTPRPTKASIRADDRQRLQIPTNALDAYKSFEPIND